MEVLQSAKVLKALSQRFLVHRASPFALKLRHNNFSFADSFKRKMSTKSSPVRSADFFFRQVKRLHTLSSAFVRLARVEIHFELNRSPAVFRSTKQHVHVFTGRFNNKGGATHRSGARAGEAGQTSRRRARLHTEICK